MKALKCIIMSSLFVLIGLSTRAQGLVVFNAEPMINQMLDEYISINKSKEFIDGWRIQLMATTDRGKMENALANFRSMYSYMNVDWTHDKPYYKIRAGAFATKLDALRLLNIVRRDFPEAYPTKDSSIRPAEILN